MISHYDFAIGLSGGVDSASAAFLLLQTGHSVAGVTMRIWDGSVNMPASSRQGCFGPDEEEDVAAAGAVCQYLGIPFIEVDLRAEYHHHVLDLFRTEYRLGRTPNPCVLCNPLLKFGFLCQKARQQISFDRFATGHYARIVQRKGRLYLCRGADPRKDQTYFLYRLSQEQLAQTFFPLGDWTKERVRELALQQGLPVASRPESQDFIGTHYNVLFSPSETPSGDIVDEEGRVLGHHEGIVHYTVGQRKGLRIASTEPWYVLRIEPQTNRVVVSRRSHMFFPGLIADHAVWATELHPGTTFRAAVRIRQKHTEAPANVEIIDAVTFRVMFDDPQLAVTPGQSAVIYDGDVVLGGGIIREPLR